ncbi:hypothetical protein HDU93_000222 [Gonapodya sp. JEL0774]|nr:hypothetical protein HDU93_000222 [Gonapodya sp. JEL0774]
MTEASKRKHDTHVHHIPPPYAKALSELGDWTHVDGQLREHVEKNVMIWNSQTHLEVNKEIGVEKAYLSISAPGVHLVPGADTEARQLAMDCNDWTAELCKKNPHSFGMFASLPLPDTHGSIAEAQRVRERYGVNAFVVMSNHHGIYQGDPSFNELYEDLNAHSSVVFMHPTAPCLRVHPDFHTHHGASFRSNTGVPQKPSDTLHNATILYGGNFSQYADPMLEYQLETARALTQLLLGGCLKRYPRIRWIASHCGGAFAPVIDRVRVIGTSRYAGTQSEVTAEEFQQGLMSLHWDLAGFALPNQLPMLIRNLGSIDDASNRLLYGSDYIWYGCHLLPYKSFS